MISQEKNENRISFFSKGIILSHVKVILFTRGYCIYLSNFFFIYFLEYEGKLMKFLCYRKDIEENDVAGMGNAYVLFDSIDDVKML